MISENMIVIFPEYEEEETKSEKDQEEDIQDIDWFNFKDLLSEVISSYDKLLQFVFLLLFCIL